MVSRSDVEQTAAHWLMLQHEPCWSPDKEQSLDSWLNASPSHKAAYWRLEHGFAQFDRLAALGSSVSSPTSAATIEPSRAWWPALAAASIVAMLMTTVVGILFAQLSPKPLHMTALATRVGEIGKLVLPDGSKVDLDTNTQINMAQKDDR